MRDLESNDERPQLPLPVSYAIVHLLLLPIILYDMCLVFSFFTLSVCYEHVFTVNLCKKQKRNSLQWPSFFMSHHKLQIEYVSA